MNHKYLINTKDDFKLLVDYLEKAPIFAYDTETNGKFSQYEVQLVGMSFGFDLFSVYLPLMHNEGKQLDISYCLDALKPIFADHGKQAVAHNAKFDEMVMETHGVSCQNVLHDTMVMAWLLSRKSREPKGLKPQVLQRFGVKMQDYEDVVKAGPKIKGVARDFNFAKVPVDQALSYAADDAYFTLKLFQQMVDQLKRDNLWNAYYKIERPLTRVVGRMERKGVLIDRDFIEQANKEFPLIEEEVAGLVYEQAGEVFNINSPVQLGKVLIEKMKIEDESKIPTTPTGQMSFDKDTLKLLKNKHPIVENILRVKKIVKIHGTFVEGLIDKIEKDGRLHASFNPTGTDTGRFSCNGPNLQQIEGGEVEGIRIRNFFVAPPGKVLVVGDYSQIELRVLAHLSKDEQMIEAFLSGRDFHDETARTMLKMQGFEISADTEVLPRQRFNAKALNFGIPYGRGPVSVGLQLGVDPKCGYWPEPQRDDSGHILRDYNDKILWFAKGQRLAEPCHECGKCFIEDWLDAFPQVRVLKAKTIAEAEARGYVRTLAGRKRYLPNINSSILPFKSGAERQAFNTRIQGSAADIIKLAMVALDKPLRQLNSRMILTVHDELGVEAPEDKAEDVVAVMKEIMEKPLNGKNPLCLPLKTEPNIGLKWGEAK